ncbi:MAG: hypothetical protein JO192_08565 [Candidatus Eremiobacteraeota bacterium]|nr:hypothetical protein [Candidatus Eremiobacteraeota bacterium]
MRSRSAAASSPSWLSHRHPCAETSRPRRTAFRAGGARLDEVPHDLYSQVDKQIDIAIQNIASGQMAAKEAMRQAQQNSLAELQRAGFKL